MKNEFIYEFGVDDTVRFSEAGKATIKKMGDNHDRTGKVVGFTKDGYPLVRWGTSKTPSTIHPSFIERVYS